MGLTPPKIPTRQAGGANTVVARMLNGVLERVCTPIRDVRVWCVGCHMRAGSPGTGLMIKGQ